MKNLKLTISYDGSRYYGWERQPGRDTIQGKLEAVLSRMVNAEVNVIGRGPDGRGRARKGDGCQLLPGDRYAAGRNPRLYEPVPAG